MLSLYYLYIRHPMETTQPQTQSQRPRIVDYYMEQPTRKARGRREAAPRAEVPAGYPLVVKYLSDMLSFRKSTEAGFSILQATQSLRKISPSLVSLVLKNKRSLTLDRADEFAKLMGLDASEKIYFKQWLNRLDQPLTALKNKSVSENENTTRKKQISVGILKDWINVYVKDFFQLPAIQKNPRLLYDQLISIAQPARIEKAIKFLHHEGYLRRTPKGQTVLETHLAVADPQMPSLQIRRFHKAALEIAKVALDLYPISDRLANTMTIALDEQAYAELLELSKEYAEKLQEFASQPPVRANRLYQVILNISPIGGKLP